MKFKNKSHILQDVWSDGGFLRRGYSVSLNNQLNNGNQLNDGDDLILEDKFLFLSGSVLIFMGDGHQEMVVVEKECNQAIFDCFKKRKSALELISKYNLEIGSKDMRWLDVNVGQMIDSVYKSKIAVFDIFKSRIEDGSDIEDAYEKFSNFNKRFLQQVNTIKDGIDVRHKNILGDIECAVSRNVNIEHRLINNEMVDEHIPNEIKLEKKTSLIKKVVRRFKI